MKLKHDKRLSSFAVNFNLRHYIQAAVHQSEAAVALFAAKLAEKEQEVDAHVQGRKISSAQNAEDLAALRTEIVIRGRELQNVRHTVKLLKVGRCKLNPLDNNEWGWIQCIPFY